MEKSWGPDYVRFGIGLSSDFSSQSSFFNLAASYRKTWINSLGASWRNMVQFGFNNMVASEFYQPLNAEGEYFVAPTISYLTRPVYLYQGKNNVASYNFSSAQLGLALGANFKRYGELRIGLIGGSLKPQLETGSVFLAPDEDRIRQERFHHAMQTAALRAVTFIDKDQNLARRLARFCLQLADEVVEVAIRLAVAEQGIGMPGGLDLSAGRLAPDRHVPGDRSVLPDRRGMGLDPVMVAVPAAVLDDSRPRPAALEGGPGVAEDFGRHVRVPDHVVRLADEFLGGEAAHIYKVVIYECNQTALIGMGNEDRIFVIDLLAAADGLVVAHFEPRFLLCIAGKLRIRLLSTFGGVS